MFCGVRHPVNCYCDLCTMVYGGYHVSSRYTQSGNGTSRRKRKRGRKVRKPSDPFRAQSTEVVFADDGFAKEFAALHQYLTSVRWDDGSPRHTATLTIFVDGGCLKVFLNDRHFDRSVCVNAKTFAEALEILNAQLDNDSCEWRRKRAATNTGGSTPF